MQIEIAIISLIQAVAVAIIGGLLARDAKKRNEIDAKAEARAELRMQESHLSLTMMATCLKLGMATARAVKEGNPNGYLDTAVSEAMKADEVYQAFLTKMTSSRMGDSMK